ncbi:MAG TPA: hypothetical protein VN328_04355, partial [Thermodesulfovibrionales bacterium]|nr:hypothetical protein [Thermodesulfovibrionales bacterium]
RFTAVQRRIDDYRRTVRLTDEEARDYRVRLDAIRHDYTRVLDGNRFIQFNEKDVSRSLHQLEKDLDRHR